MNSLNIKLVLSIVGFVMLVTPAFAQAPHGNPAPGALYNYQAPAADPSAIYPNPVARSGSGESIQSGAVFNTGY